MLGDILIASATLLALFLHVSQGQWMVYRTRGAVIRLPAYVAGTNACDQWTKWPTCSDPTCIVLRSIRVPLSPVPARFSKIFHREIPPLLAQCLIDQVN